MQVEEIIVADSSPLIGLARIKQLQLLPSLAKRVLVPNAVFAEVSSNPQAPGAPEIIQANWLEIQSPGSVPETISQLDRGEAEAISLALKHNSSLLLVDDLRARRIAREMNIRIIGTVGILLRAKATGLITKIAPAINSLVASGIYLNEQLIASALDEAGE